MTCSTHQHKYLRQNKVSLAGVALVGGMAHGVGRRKGGFTGTGGIVQPIVGGYLYPIIAGTKKCWPLGKWWNEMGQLCVVGGVLPEWWVGEKLSPWMRWFRRLVGTPPGAPLQRGVSDRVGEIVALPQSFKKRKSLLRQKSGIRALCVCRCPVIWAQTSRRRETGM